MENVNVALKTDPIPLETAPLAARSSQEWPGWELSGIAR
jgi:hypothetical protein